MTEVAQPSVCIVGCASWDTLLPVDHYPAESEYCIATNEIQMPGGTSTNVAVALARLGMPPRFVGVVGDDWRGERLRAGLEDAGVICDTLGVHSGQDSDRSIIPISPSGSRTIFWIKGAMLGRGDPLDIPAIFRHPVVYLDIVDLDLWADILDVFDRDRASLPEVPLLVGQAVFVAGVLTPDAALPFVGRHDLFIGGEWEWRLMTGAPSRGEVIACLQHTVRETRLQMAIVTCGADGCIVITKAASFNAQAAAVHVVDTTGAGDAFAAGFVYGQVKRWPPERCAQFANAIGGLATRALGSQVSLPTVDEAWQLAFGPDADFQPVTSAGEP
ncbi:MAG: carbohydrate kinase family protein [Chloroflexota bacterium]|nr:carbohydrate kinase family protein [Chloroflexota bacterium]